MEFSMIAVKKWVETFFLLIIVIYVVTSLAGSILLGITECLDMLKEKIELNNIFIVIMYLLWGIYGLINGLKIITCGLQQFAYNILKHVHETTIVLAMRYIYFYGPGGKHFGFWKGKLKEDICSQLYQSPGEFWKNHQNECNIELEKEIYSYVVGFDILFVCYLLWRFFKKT